AIAADGSCRSSPRTAPQFSPHDLFGHAGYGVVNFGRRLHPFPDQNCTPVNKGTDRNWRHYARTFVTAVLRQMHRAQEKDIAKLYWLLLLAPAEELRVLLDGTPAAAFLASDNGKFLDSVRSVTAAHVSGIEHVARQTVGSTFSVRE